MYSVKIHAVINPPDNHKQSTFSYYLREKTEMAEAI